MFDLPKDVRQDLAAGHYLTTKTVEMLIKEGVDGVKCLDSVFAFPPGIMPMIDRDVKEFKKDGSAALLHQR